MSQAASLSMVKYNLNARQTSHPQTPVCSFKVNLKRSTMATSTISSSSSSSVPIQHANQNLSGDSFFGTHLRKLSPLPIKVLSTKLGRNPEDIVKLDANENPYAPPPPPEVLEALGSLKFPYIYPDPESRQLRASLAEDSGLESDYILVGCGCDELIDLIMRCVLDPGDKILDFPPTFTMNEFDAGVNAAQVIKFPRKQDFSLNVECIAEAVKQEKPKCIFLTSPNNSDGSMISDDYLLKILGMPILVVLDEAYVELSRLKSRMQWVKKHDNLIVLRTFSKRAGLAGLHVGYGAFLLSIIECLRRAKQPYNVSVAACAALQNSLYLEALAQKPDRLFKLLKEVPFLNPYPSYSNFILCEVTSGMDAKKLKDDLSKMGIMFQYYNKKEMKIYILVTVGYVAIPSSIFEYSWGAATATKFSQMVQALVQRIWNILVKLHNRAQDEFRSLYNHTSC